MLPIFCGVKQEKSSYLSILIFVRLYLAITGDSKKCLKPYSNSVRLMKYPTKTRYRQYRVKILKWPHSVNRIYHTEK